MEKSALVPCHQLADRTVWTEADFQSKAFIYLSDNRVCCVYREKAKKAERVAKVEVGTALMPKHEGHVLWWGMVLCFPL